MKGVDVSSYQSGIDLRSLKDQGVDFAILKIGEGKTLADPCFDSFYQDAEAAGIAVGAYFYSYATTTERAVEDAQRALKLAGGISLPLGIYMDVEDAGQLALRDSVLTAVVKAFCDTIRAGGYRPGAYGSLGKLWAKVGPSYLGDDVLVWVAAWGNSAPKMGDVWQYSAREAYKGFNGNIDGDKALSERFIALINAAKEQPPADPQPSPEPEPSDGTFSLSGIPVLKKGDKGAAVIALQGELIALGYPCGSKRRDWRGRERADGIFGNVTEESVRSFQRSRNLNDSGVADKITRAALIGV